jgi:hypothetical protein
MTTTRPPADASQTPVGNWLRMHRGWGGRPKVAHRTWLGAHWHLRSNRRKFRVVADLYWVYPCWFTDENGFGRKHYHIGHVPKGRRLPGHGKPREAKLYVGVFAVADGFEVRTFDSRPATCRPPQPTIRRALREYLAEGGE